MPQRPLAQIPAQGGRSAITYRTRDLDEVAAEQPKRRKGGWSPIYGWTADPKL